MFKIAPGNFVKPTFEAWEAPVLPLNYTRNTTYLAKATIDAYFIRLELSPQQDKFSGNPRKGWLNDFITVNQRGKVNLAGYQTVHLG